MQRIEALQAGDEPSAQPTVQPTITITTEVVQGETVRIQIADNGSGIPEKIQTRIFEPFFTTKPVGSGVGLGLSMSYTILKHHRGTLVCHSTVGIGTEMVIELPLRSR